MTLGTDGYGRSDSRENLRDFFEINEEGEGFSITSNITSDKPIFKTNNNVNKVDINKTFRFLYFNNDSELCFLTNDFTEFKFDKQQKNFVLELVNDNTIKIDNFTMNLLIQSVIKTLPKTLQNKM